MNETLTHAAVRSLNDGAMWPAAVVVAIDGGAEVSSAHSPADPHR